MWLLANGLMPLSESAAKWFDQPSAKLLPLGMFQRLLLAALRPLGCGLDSDYHRIWDRAKNCWLQESVHVLKLGPVKQRVFACIEIHPGVGRRKLELRTQRGAWTAMLLETAMSEDLGIPAWKDAFVAKDSDKF
jgi:hypothetical protein